MAQKKTKKYHPGGGVPAPRPIKRKLKGPTTGTPKRTPTTGRRGLRAPTPIKRKLKGPTTGTPKRTPTTGKRTSSRSAYRDASNAAGSAANAARLAKLKEAVKRSGREAKLKEELKRGGRRAGSTGKAKINPNLSNVQKIAADSFRKKRGAKTKELLSNRTPTQARPTGRSTRVSRPRANPMSRFRQAGTRAMSRFNRSRRR